MSMYCRDARFCRQQKNMCAWPAAVLLPHAKPYGSKEELKKVGTFVLQTGLSV